MAEWNQAQFVNPQVPPSDPFAILVLNSPINIARVLPLLEHASFIICADGGANRFYDMMKDLGRENEILPDLILGDLDSIKATPTRSHYESLDVSVEHDGDQYSTDFTKCLRYLNNNAHAIIAGQMGRKKNEVDAEAQTQSSPTTTTTTTTSILSTLVLGGIGGRIDQGISQLHHLYTIPEPTATTIASSPSQPTQDPALDARYASAITSPTSCYIRPFLLSSQNITVLLSAGLNTIYLSPPSAPTTPWPTVVGILPLDGPAVISTTGLKWDVVDWDTRIGGKLSSSNQVRSEEDGGPDLEEGGLGRVVVTVKTDRRVLFTAEV